MRALLAASPCCGKPLLSTHFEYRDYETGYRDEGDVFRCSNCGAEVDEGDVVVAEEEMAHA